MDRSIQQNNGGAGFLRFFIEILDIKKLTYIRADYGQVSVLSAVFTYKD